VLELLYAAGDEGLTTREISAGVNLGLSRLEAMLKVLDVEGAVARAGTRWRHLGDETGWHYDADRYRAITELRRDEQRAMAAFGSDGRCLMRALQEELDDPEPADCGRCSVCAGPRFDAEPDPVVVRAAQAHLRSQPLTFEPKRMAPDAEGAMKKIPDAVRVEDGRALARVGDAGWSAEIEAGLRAGRLDDEVIEAAAALVREWKGVARVGRRRPRPPARERHRRRRRHRRRPPPRRGARPPVPPDAHPVGGPAAAARDAQCRDPVRERPRRLRDHRRRPHRAVPARRRPPLLRLDAVDDRRAAAPAGSGPVFPFALLSSF
jgi:ATP-dependent DNA helicase RecQ